MGRQLPGLKNRSAARLDGRRLREVPESLNERALLIELDVLGLEIDAQRQKGVRHIRAEPGAEWHEKVGPTAHGAPHP